MNGLTDRHIDKQTYGQNRFIKYGMASTVKNLQLKQFEYKLILIWRVKLNVKFCLCYITK